MSPFGKIVSHVLSHGVNTDYRGESLRLPKGVALRLRNTIRRVFSQGRRKASQNLPTGVLTVPFVHSTDPEDWGDKHNENAAE